MAQLAAQEEAKRMLVKAEKAKKAAIAKEKRDKAELDQFLNEFLPKQNVERSWYEPVINEVVAESFADLPELIKNNWEPSDPWGKVVDDIGDHQWNQRLPGGYHLTIDKDQPGINLHYDAFDPLDSPYATYNHGATEVLGIKLGLIDNPDPVDNYPNW